MSLTLLSKQMLMATLAADATVQGLTEWADTGLYKIFMDNAHANAPMPYIIVTHYSGGRDRKDRRQSIDAWWEVCAHMENQDQQVAFEKAIYAALDSKMPVETDEDYGAYHHLEEVYPMVTRYQRQNRTFFKVGGIYRLCLTERE
jgi:hypothetical protein